MKAIRCASMRSRDSCFKGAGGRCAVKHTGMIINIKADISNIIFMIVELFVIKISPQVLFLQFLQGDNLLLLHVEYHSETRQGLFPGFR